MYVKTMFYLILYILICFQSLQVFSYPCETHKSCDDCIRDFPYCHWCSSEDYKDVRCKPVSENFTDCANTENSKNFTKNIEDRNFSSTHTKVTQIRPQIINITAKVELTQEFVIQFKAAEDYPADLYFLIDASRSMKHLIKYIGDASLSIHNEMRSITKNVLLGMGTFIDKNTAPYVRARDPSTNTYSFRHGISMTNDFETFKKTIYNTLPGSNKDEPEAGFDGLAQVMACKNEIGWREESRKIIFYITDDLFHSAGDGRWAGIFQPYDGKCYTINGTYTKELEMDYPSIGIINKLSVDEEMTIVFIVNQKIINNYETLIKTNERWKVIRYNVGKNGFEFEKSQIQELISRIYEEISHNIKLKLSIPSEVQNDIKFSFSPDCYTGYKNQECIVKKGIEKIFKGKVTLLPHFRQNEITVNLTIQGIKEKIILNIKKPKCDCGEVAVVNSSSCSGSGIKKCGVCECNSKSTGKKCECHINDMKGGDQADCKPPNSTALLCNGFGACICGTCQCDDGREGEHCQCDNNTCPKHCSGNGRCSCSKCTCNRGWTGDACDCRDESCKIVHNKACNNRGDCKCGKCICQPPAEWDARESQTDACEIIPCKTCHNIQCLKLKDCTLCHLNAEPVECMESCQKSIIVDKITNLDNVTDADYFVCENVQAAFGCYTRFQYKYDDVDYKVHVLVQTEKDCLKNYYWYGGGFLLMLLIIGLLTLIAWKVLTDLRDRREYERFIKSAAEGDAKRENSIYIPPTTTFRNPAFQKKQECKTTD